MKPAEAGDAPVKKEEGWWETVKVIVEALLDRARRPHAAVPAVQHSLGLAGADAAGRRLPVRVEIRLRLFALFAAGLPRPRSRRRCPAASSPPQPKRGDIIVFKLPSDGQTDYIKRADRPARRQDPGAARPAVSSTARWSRASRSRPTRRSTISASPTEAPRYLETLPGGVKHEIIQIDGDEGTFDNTSVYEVPPGHYFMMGDNRDNSSDSRLAGDQGGVGYVPFENLIGRGRDHLLLDRRGHAGMAVVEVAVDGALGPHLPAGALTARPRSGRARRAVGSRHEQAAKGRTHGPRSAARLPLQGSRARDAAR